MSTLLHTVGHNWHAAVSRSPHCVSIAYLRLLSVLIRSLPEGHFKDRLLNKIRSVRWPDLGLPPKRVWVTDEIGFLLKPHMGEFDLEALLRRRLTYESPVFELLGQRMKQYTAVIEIGANVGVFTMFFAAMFRAQHKSLDQIFSFEPSDEAYARLQTNLRSNGFLEVQTFKCALGDRMGIAAFHEPEGHLTNGSLLPAFSSLFSKDVKRRQVPVLCGEVLADLLVDQTRLLIKIDAEGAEPMILWALAPVLAKWKPDLLIEVLPGWDAELQHLQVLAEYIPFHITPQGLVRSASVAAGQVTAGQERDLLLIHKENTP